MKAMLTKPRNLVMTCVVIALACGSAYAQSSLDVFGGYSYQRLNSASGAETNLSSGWAAEAQVNMAHTVALVTSFSGGYGTQSGADLAFYTYMGGPRFSLHRGRASLFAHALFGAGGLTASAGGVSITENAFATALGTGVDVRVAPRLAVRVIQADYVLSRLASNTQNNLRLSTGLVFRLAGAKNAN